MYDGTLLAGADIGKCVILCVRKMHEGWRYLSNGVWHWTSGFFAGFGIVLARSPLLWRRRMYSYSYQHSTPPRANLVSDRDGISNPCISSFRYSRPVLA